ncbi:Uu.00g005340.m01.CDS01 [Anthostomella pinea]|uniref:Uu.00g005340.m01.CDS01 n=1 Tax=Anthostomella pinea TaxID=933095 RepID=A0AAI8YGH2_9PEZI|nr:Uu.00g005340.m01.CDS01 [Anthostomella pinea]
MPSKPTSPGPSDVTADLPKGSSSTSDEPLPAQDPTTQAADHDDHAAIKPAAGSEDHARDSSSSSSSSSSSPSSQESGEASPVDPADAASNAPPFPNEPPPATEDDGWDFHWDASHQAYFFHNRITNESTWENPRQSKSNPAASQNTQLQTPPTTAALPPNEELPAGGYNPAIHGDYDPNAWYAQKADVSVGQQPTVDSAAAYAAMGSFNRFTGRWQGADQDPERHTDEAKSKRQMNAFFDVDAAANSHDGRSLKAERSGKKPSKSELKQFKEKRRAKKEERRRAWLRD